MDVRNLAPSPKKTPTAPLHLEHSKELGDVLMLTRSHHYHLGCNEFFHEPCVGFPSGVIKQNKKNMGTNTGNLGHPWVMKF